MKTIQTQNQDLTDLFRKFIKLSFVIFLIIILTFGVCVWWHRTEKNAITKHLELEQIVKNFEKNKEDFEKFASVIIDEDAVYCVFKEFYDNPRFLMPDGTSIVSPKKQLRYVEEITELGKNEIITFFDRYSPSHVDNTSNGEVDIAFYTDDKGMLSLVYNYDLQSIAHKEHIILDEDWAVVIWDLS